MKATRISVLIPVYNAESFLEESINSILNQTFTDFELLIGDDGSTDRSLDIVSSFQDKRIILIKNKKNEGVANTLNKLLEAAKGEFIAVQHSDDISSPFRIEKQLRFLEKNSDVGLCGSNVSIFGKKKSRLYFPLKDNEIRAYMIFNNPFIHPAVMFKRSLFEDANIRYNQYFFPAEDYDLWFKLSLITKLANIPERLLLYRCHENNASRLKENLLIEKAIEIRKNILLQTISYQTTSLEAHLLHLSSTSKFENDTDLLLFEKLLLRLLKENNLKGYYEQNVIEKLFFHFWTSCCFKSKNIRLLNKIQIFVGSELFHFFHLLRLLSRRNLQSKGANLFLN